MNPQDFLKKVEDGTLSDDEMRSFMASMQEKMQELKQQDPSKYLEVVHNLNEALEAANETLEA